MTEAREYIYPGRFDQVVELCGLVAVEAEKVGFTDDEIFRIELACDEACTNIIQHAYGAEDEGEIRLILQQTENAFIIILRDKGRAFDPDEVPKPNIPSNPNNIDELTIGGLGIHFIRNIMDEISFSVDRSGHNKLVMVKYLSRSAKKWVSGAKICPNR